jgi:hypothetical protein
MFCTRQLSIILVAFAFLSTALFFAFGPVWVTWASVAGLFIVVAAAILCALTPKSILDLQFENCIRRDGSWSCGRQRVEAGKQLKLFREIVFAFTVVVVSTLTTLFLANSSLVPIELGLHLAAQKIERPANEQVTFDAITKKKFEKWYDNKSLDVPKNRESYKDWVWNDMPLILSCGCLWFVACAMFVGKFYIYSVHQLRKSAITRGEAYYWRDLGNETERLQNRKLKKKQHRRRHKTEAEASPG